MCTIPVVKQALISLIILSFLQTMQSATRIAMNINMDANRTLWILNTGEVHYFLAKLPKVFKTNRRRTLKISTSLHRQMQSIRFMLVSFGLTPAAKAWTTYMRNYNNNQLSTGKWSPATSPDTKNQKTPVRDKNRKCISRTNAVPPSLRGLRGLLLENSTDLLNETKVTRTDTGVEWLTMWWIDTL